ncbi:MAG: 4Fe-4S dicluster domain-containing protein [Promethearchaeia archaeon]|nr:MAG: 4Fe-4S dicluster domain-containing protein [Candidatus Lokiarchaeia archaeon]
MATKVNKSVKNNESAKPDTAAIVHKILVVDPVRCTGCEICESVCGMVHDGVFNPMNSRIHRVRIEPVINSSISCVSCYDPECVKACPLSAITKNLETGILEVDQSKCDGCGACVRSCPFGAITVHTKNKKAIMCDMCTSTSYGEPQCVEYCPKGAIFIEEIDPNVNEDRLETLRKILHRGFPQPPEGEILN